MTPAKVLTHDTSSGKVNVLFDDGSEEEVVVGWGNGYWCRVLHELRARGRVVEPEDFGPGITFLYYWYAHEELRDNPEKMARLGYFECPKCHCIYSKSSFESFDPCDNCLHGREAPAR